ncbi:MAG: cell division/cell wall cluster transcriptional repressor MraZ [Clostridiales bacterium]|jgi:MraZ protein|nr:cell division/cell wall cluster transcriptional repressor MraZ [Clostridiales bacterium]
MIFFGEYNIQLDDKNRMRIPNKLRSLINEPVYILHGTGGCLFVMNESEFKKFVERFNHVPISDIKAQEAIRKIMSSVFPVEEDAQGRFVLPKKAKDYANINKQIVFIGANSRMEIWGQENYEKQGYLSAESFETAIVDLKAYGI